jgi:hypothetical protein
MNSYKLTTTNTQKEKNTIHQILINKKYDPSIIVDVKKKRKTTKKQDREETEKKQNGQNSRTCARKHGSSQKFSKNQHQNYIHHR